MTVNIFYLFLPLLFCTNDYQLIRVWMKDVSSSSVNGVTDDSLFLTVEVDVPKLTSPDFKYAINDVIERQPPHKYAKYDDDFRIYGNRHWNQQVFKFFPDTGLILSERFPNMALNVVSDYLQLVEKKSVPDNWKWKIKKPTFDSLYQLRHSNFETEHFLIDQFNPNSNLNNNTHITVDDIQPQFVNEITGSINNPETDFPEIIQKRILETKVNTEKNTEKNIEKNTEKIKPEKKNTTLWIFISVTVILMIIGVFVKIGCFPNYKIIGSNSRSGDLEEKLSQNPNN